jgi:hypothetical protein
MISFGTERLLGTRYGPNVPLSFDGGLLHWERSETGMCTDSIFGRYKSLRTLWTT